jgi:NAD(P)-dependent dehydrogenase (short-subunit alcohol dehydrogenase family)
LPRGYRCFPRGPPLVFVLIVIAMMQYAVMTLLTQAARPFLYPALAREPLEVGHEQLRGIRAGQGRPGDWGGHWDRQGHRHRTRRRRAGDGEPRPHPRTRGKGGRRHRDGWGTAIAVAADISSRAECQAMVEQLLTAYGRWDTLMNNAAAIITRPFPQITEAEFDMSFAVNVKGVLHGLQLA